MSFSPPWRGAGLLSVLLLLGPAFCGCITFGEYQRQTELRRRSIAIALLPEFEARAAASQPTSQPAESGRKE